MLDVILPALAAASVLVPFVMALLLTMIPQKCAKWMCITAASISTAFTLAIWIKFQKLWVGL